MQYIESHESDIECIARYSKHISTTKFPIETSRRRIRPQETVIGLVVTDVIALRGR